MAKFDLDSYETVESRLARFWVDHPKGRVLTDLVFHDERRFIVKAEIFFDRDDLSPVSSGYAEEIVGTSPVNRVSALENGETSAIGRSLANCGYASQGKRPSREEMEKVERYNAEPRKAVAPKKTEVKEYSQADIDLARQLIIGVNSTTSIEILKQIWSENPDLRDIQIDNTTLKDAVTNRKKELEAQ
jgi:hypothetical protein